MWSTMLSATVPAAVCGTIRCPIVLQLCVSVLGSKRMAGWYRRKSDNPRDIFHILWPPAASEWTNGDIRRRTYAFCFLLSKNSPSQSLWKFEKNNESNPETRDSGTWILKKIHSNLKKKILRGRASTSNKPFFPYFTTTLWLDSDSARKITLEVTLICLITESSRPMVLIWSKIINIL